MTLIGQAVGEFHAARTTEHPELPDGTSIRWAADLFVVAVVLLLLNMAP